MSLANLKKTINKRANKRLAKLYSRFFKTGKGEYGEGDVFLGLRVPTQRKIAKEFKDLRVDDAFALLQTNIHEYRLIALFILIQSYVHSDRSIRKTIYQNYLKNYNHINNWDLVDISAPKIVGDYLLDKKRTVLTALAKSQNLWKKRIAMLACFTFIKQNDFKDAINIASILLYDDHDLIHKAVGWMLREIGKRDTAVLEKFLKQNYKTMPRTMLRYAIEKFPEKKRKFYMKK